MPRLKFWKRETTPRDETRQPVITTKFGIRPRTDLELPALPDDPDLAARATALGKQRDSMLQELRVAEEALDADNQWRRQIALIGEALESIQREREALGHVSGPPGAPLRPVPISDLTASMEPVATVRFRIGETGFVYAEELDWAERGTQIARSDLHQDQGDIGQVIPADFPTEQREYLTEHLVGSLFTFATDVRDRAIEDQPLPEATLADLARPSSDHGGWLDWSGQSPIAQARQLELNRLRGEQERLEHERSQLLEEESKTIESIPIKRRRLADVEQKLAALTSTG